MESIYLKEHTGIVPVEKSEFDKNYIKHVFCDGARFHVVSYSDSGMCCSEKNCIINKPQQEE